jgi:cellulose biosynthesis protein BcsQ
VQGRDGNAARSAILAAGLAQDEQGRPRGLVLLPVTPSPADVWETTHTTKLLTEAAPMIQRRTGRDLWSRVRLVMNRVDPKEVISAATADALDAHPAALLDTVVQRRTIYPTVFATGQAVCELPASRAVEAATEITTLTTDVTRIALKEN